MTRLFLPTASVQPQAKLSSTRCPFQITNRTLQTATQKARLRPTICYKESCAATNSPIRPDPQATAYHQGLEQKLGIASNIAGEVNLPYPQTFLSRNAIIYPRDYRHSHSPLHKNSVIFLTRSAIITPTRQQPCCTLRRCPRRLPCRALLPCSTAASGRASTACRPALRRHHPYPSSPRRPVSLAASHRAPFSEPDARRKIEAQRTHKKKGRRGRGTISLN